MGVRGLQNFLKRSVKGQVPDELGKRPGHGDSLLVDGIGFALWCCEQLVTKYDGGTLALELGGPYNLLRKEFIKELNTLKEGGVEVQVFIDGHDATNPLKGYTRSKRLEQKNEKWAVLYSAVLDDRRKGERQIIPSQQSLPYPYLAVDELRAALTELGISVVECQGEADQEIALACVDESHFIYSGDTDFLFFSGRIQLIFFGDLTGRAAAGSDAIPTIWTRKLLARILSLEQENNLIELAILCGNDATSVVPRSHFDALTEENIALPVGHTFEDIAKILTLVRSIEAKRGEFYVTASSSPKLQLAIEYSRAFYSLADLGEYVNDDELADEEHVGDNTDEKEMMSLSREQVDDIIEYTSASTKDNVTTCPLDVVVYLQQSVLFEEQLTEFHIQAFELMQEALAEALSDAEFTYKFPLCPRPSEIKWANICAAQTFQRTFAKFKKYSGDLYDWDERQNQPSGFYDGHLFHQLLAHLEEKAKTEKASSSLVSTSDGKTSVADQEPTTREKLPIDDHRENILSRIGSERVVIIHGETGCGKSSRLPVFLLEDAEARGESCRMFVSQPRRIAASSLMKRVRSTGLGDKVGLRMGHGIVDEKPKTRITFVTTGYLLRLLANHPESFRSHTHLIIDEVHERSVDGDVLCLLARRLLLVHPTIRLILMSATVHVSLYKDYFSNQGEYYGSLDVLSVGVRRFPVQIFYADELDRNPDLPPAVKTGAAKKIVEMTSRRTRVRCDETVPLALAKEQYTLAVNLIRNTAKVGTGVLVFVSGINDITELMERFEGLGRYYIVCIHSELPFEEQEAAFEPTPPDQVKVVIATNAAESSITVPDVDIVICLGTHKALRYNSFSHRVQLVNTWISKASATQRAGRTGRVRPGTVYRLYSRSHFEGFDDHCQSEVHRRPLQDVILDLRSMLEESSGFDGVVPILEDLLEPPDMNNVSKSFEFLHRQGMITLPDDNGELTSVGRLSGSLPVDLSLGRLIAIGVSLGVGTEASVFASALSQSRSPFRIASPMIHTDPDEYNEIIRSTLIGAAKLDDKAYSEPIMMLNIFVRWREMDYSMRNLWCNENGLAHSRVRQFISSTEHLIDRVNESIKLQYKKQKGNCDEDVVNVSFLPSSASIGGILLNTYRLILTWGADGNLIRQNPQKKKLTLGDFSTVTLTGDPIERSHLDPLFPSSVKWDFENALRRVFDAPLQQSANLMDLLKTLAKCMPQEAVESCAAVWIVQQMPFKQNRKDPESSMVVALSDGVDFSATFNFFKSIFGLSITEGGSFMDVSPPHGRMWRVYVVAMVTKSELMALQSVHEHLPHALALLLPREGNAKLTCTNVTPDQSMLRSIFNVKDGEQIASTVQACKQVLKFENPFKSTTESSPGAKVKTKNQKKSTSEKSKGKSKGKGNDESHEDGTTPTVHPPLLIDISLGIRLLNSYGNGYKDKKMRLWQFPHKHLKSAKGANGAVPLVTAVNEKSSSNPYHSGVVVGSKEWREGRNQQSLSINNDRGAKDDDAQKMIMPIKTVSSTWSILQLRLRQIDDGGFRAEQSTPRYRTTVVHSGMALMPRQSLQSVAIHCGHGSLWGVAHNILFLGGQESGTQEIVRCEGITLLPPGRRWLSLALQCAGMDHHDVNMLSITDSRGLVNGPFDTFLDLGLSDNDLEKCKAFYWSLEEHQQALVCKNDSLIEQLSDIFHSWLENFENEEEKLEKEFERYQKKALADAHKSESQEVDEELFTYFKADVDNDDWIIDDGPGNTSSVSSVGQHDGSDDDGDNIDAVPLDFKTKKVQKSGKTPTATGDGEGAGNGSGNTAFKCPMCAKKFKTLRAIVAHFDSTGHTHSEKRKIGSAQGVRECCLVTF